MLVQENLSLLSERRQKLEKIREKSGLQNTWSLDEIDKMKTDVKVWKTPTVKKVESETKKDEESYI